MADGTTYNDAATPMLKQYQRIKAQHPDAILLYRLGDFYEMFYDDAVLASNILDITLTSRNKNDPNPIPLCGVPFHSVDPYIEKLLNYGQKVAICEQTEDPKQAKGVVKREVTRVLTPGVRADGLGLEAHSHNYLASCCYAEGKYGFALADASTGFFQALSCESFQEILEEICRTEPRELLLPESSGKGELEPDLLMRRFPEMTFTTFEEMQEGENLLKSLHGYDQIQAYPSAKDAAARLMAYLNATQMGQTGQITSIQGSDGKVMRLDEVTKRNLELVRTMREGEREGSLLVALDRTKSAAGARMLKRWLLYPLLDPHAIHARLDAVENLLTSSDLLRLVPEKLQGIYDIERITSRAALGSANARDLKALAESLALAGELRKLLEGSPSKLLTENASRIDQCEELRESLERHIVEEPPISLRDGGLISDGVSQELDELRNLIRHGKEVIASIEAEERARTGITSLKIKFNKVFGYYLEVTKSNLGKVPDDYIRKQTLTNAERFITPKLKEYEEKVLGGQERCNALEMEIFGALRNQVAAVTASLQRTAMNLAQIDALSSLALIATEYDYRRPKVEASRVLEIEEGRHPIVERLHPEERFVPNDVHLDGEARKLLMITGPNMSGKSTVMRQTALIVLMAQMGSFVPARSARIGMVDRIFTRVGASDALAQGQSTFMVEMSEAATILREAGAESLIIIDEIGRGTSTFDGLAIAWAVAEDLHDRVRARTMFATHYHELTDLAITRTGIVNVHVSVREWNGQVIFLRKLLPGATSHSYGIQVAGLAGLPESVISRSREVLANLEEAELDDVGRPRLANSPAIEAAPAKTQQFQLFTAQKPSAVELKLKSIDPNAITPLEALTILHDLTKSI